jgi:HSP20 family protein
MQFEFYHSRRHIWEPQIDVCERPNEIVVFVEIPGVKKADVRLNWSDGVLTISGEKKVQASTGVLRHHCMERPHGHFRRDLAINIPIDREKARAELRDGLMCIYLPKRTSAPSSGNIPIVE